MKPRQKVAYDIACINKVMKELACCSALRPGSYYPQLEDELASLGEWTSEVYAYVKTDDSAIVSLLAERMYVYPDLRKYQERHRAVMPCSVSASLSKAVPLLPTLCHFISNRQSKEKGKFLFLTDGLANEKAVALLQRAVDAKLLTNRYQPMRKTSLSELKTIAFAVGTLMHFSFREKWISFDQQWPCGCGNLRGAYIPREKIEKVNNVIRLYPEVDFKPLLEPDNRYLYYSCKTTPKSRKYLYSALKNGGYISKSTSFQHFCRIFASNSRRKPVQWIDRQCLLGYLAYNAFKKPNDKLWLTTCECFSLNGKKPNACTLRSHTNKIIRAGTVLDKKLLDIAETFKELSEAN
ncbi:MAG: hypothetical protein ACI4T9_10700 [Prevotella sp.]